MSGGRAIKRLKESLAKSAAVDARSAKAQAVETAAVHDAPPYPAAKNAEALRVFLGKHGLGFAITGLLFQIRQYSLAAVMPHHCARSESDAVAGSAQPPADVNVIAGLAECDIKAS